MGFVLHMNDTPNLALPYILPAQAQKHVTHNEAIRAIDGLMQLSVASRTLTTPPESPANGDRYIVAAAATGGWTGQDGKVAAYQDGAWAFYVPKEGWRAWCAAEGALLVYRAGAWSPLSSGDGDLPDAFDNLTHAGINTTADATNRLSLKSPASLFDNEGAGHQQKINKHASGDTASMLYQTNYSGRAEMGLTGDDDFHFKVSPNGSTWFEAMKIDRNTGRVSFPILGGPREVLAANRTYYVRSDGADTNTGLANTSGGAFKTLQKAINAACALDFSLYSVTIRLADGTYTPGKFSVPTNGKIIIDGNATTPANVVVSGSTPIEVAAACDVTIQNFEAQGSSYALRTAAPGAALTIGVGMRCTGSGTAISVNKLSSVSSNGGSLFISGNKPSWLIAVENCSVQLFSMTITFSGTPAWSNVGISFAIGAAIYMWNVTMSGAATGSRYYGTTNAVLHSSGAGSASTYFPGDVNGITDKGAQQL